MTRVPRRAAAAQAVRARSKVPKPQVRKHKIIMESVTQEKKKLRSVISFETQAPPGYTFIPAGNPQFTNACKEVCRKEGHKVFTVSTTPHQRTHNLSQQVHRIGYHFPSVVVATLCMERGLYLSSTGKVLPYQQGSSHTWGEKFMSGRKADSELTQATINAEARDAIKDLFPNIPKKDLSQIIKTAFQKGKRKVGTAVELPLARRVQLAVVAHIRHVYTDYDRLLRILSFQEARTAVEEPTLAKLVQWRGDDENGKVELEDVFREVIVISDNEDDDNGSDTEEARVGRDSSVEIVSSNTLVGELQTQPVHYGKRVSVDRNSVHEQSEDEAPPGFRFVPEPVRKPKPHKHKVDRRGFSRYQAWNRALDRYKEAGNLPAEPRPTYDPEPAGVYANPVDRPAKALGESENSHIPRISGYDYPASGREPVPARYHPPQQTNPTAISAPAGEHQRHLYNNVRRDPPDVIRLTDGTVFERADRVPITERSRIPPDPMEQRIRPLPRAHQPMHSEQVKYPMPRDTLHNTASQGPSQDMISHDQRHRVLQSIEAPTSVNHIGNRRPEHDASSMRKREIKEVSGDQSQFRGGPSDSLSGRAGPIVVGEDRPEAPQKKNKLEHDCLGYGEFHAGSDGAYPSFTRTHAGHGPSQARYSPGLSRREPIGERPASPPTIAQNSPTYRQHPEDAGPRVTRKPVAAVQPVQGVSHRSQFTDDFGEHGGSNLKPVSPRVFYRSDGPGYMSTTDKPTMRSRPISHLVHPQQQHPDRYEESQFPRSQGGMTNDPRPLIRPVSPELQQYPSSNQNARENTFAPEFVRPVRWQDNQELSRYEANMSSSREERTVPVRRIAKYSLDGSSTAGQDHRSMPSASRLLQGPLPPTSRPNLQDAYSGSRDSGYLPFPSEQHSNVNTLPHRPRSPDVYGPGPGLANSGRHSFFPDSREPNYRHPPTRRPVADRPPEYYRNIPARNEMFVAGN